MKIDTRRAAMQRDIGALREALGEAALRLEEAGDDPGRLAAAQAQLAQVQHELAGAEAKLVAYDLGLQARAREETARASADTDAQVEELLELITDLGEARALTGAAIRLRGGTAALTRLGTNLDGHDVIAASIGPALASSGVGVIGPSMAPWVVIAPPSGAFQPVSLGPALERLNERRLDAIERAATFGKQEAAA